MTTYTITGPIIDVTGAKSRITGAWVRASDTRAAGSGITTEENAPVTISAAGVATFTAAPGPAVLVLSSAGEVVETVPLIIPENNATLGDAARAGAFAGESWSAIQGLAKRAVDALSGAETARDAAQGHASAAEGSAAAAAGSASAAASSVASMNDALAGAVADVLPGAVADATAVAEGHADAAAGSASAAAGSAGAAASTAAAMNDALAGAVSDAASEAEGHADAAQGHASAAEGHASAAAGSAGEAEGHASAAAGSAAAVAGAMAEAEGYADDAQGYAETAEGHATAAAGSAGAAAAAATYMGDALAGAVADATSEAEGHAADARGYAEAAEQALAVDIPDGAVTTEKIADGAVTGEKIDPRYRQETSMADVPVTSADGNSAVLRIIKTGRLVAIRPDGDFEHQYILRDPVDALKPLGSSWFAQPISALDTDNAQYTVSHVEIAHMGSQMLISLNGPNAAVTPIIYMSANDTPFDPQYIYQE